jgi:drug/metabolite transporter (DMT)-like permease
LQLYLLLPLASAVLYAMAALCMKMALGRGVTTWQVFFFSNTVLGLLFAPLLLTGSAGWNLAAAPWGILAGVLFTLGQVGTFRSLQRGDVSIATPALASKVVFVALLCQLILGARPNPHLWLAVALTTTGVFLLHRGPRHPASRPLATLGWSLFAALSFAGADVVLQQGAPLAGFTLFLPVMFGTVAALAVPLLVPHILHSGRPPLRGSTRGWLAAGSLLIGIQAVGMAIAIGHFGDATGANVVYGSRGLWSLLLLALVARHLGLKDDAMNRGTLVSRVVGSLFVLAAVVLALV